MYGRYQEPMALCNKNTELCPSLFFFKLAMKDAKSLPIFVSAGFFITSDELPVCRIPIRGIRQNNCSPRRSRIDFPRDRQIVLAFEFNVNVSSCHQKGH